MKKLCIFTLYSEKGASSQYRIYIFKEELEKNFDVQWFHFWNDYYVTKYMHNKKKYIFQIALQYLYATIKRWYQITFIAPKSDVVFFQKSIIPKMKRTFLKKLKKKHIRIIFDVDDAIYLNPRDNSNEIARNANVVICGNGTLKKHYEQFNNNCIVLPTIENTLKYQPYWQDTFTKKNIGWIGSKTTIKNLELIVEPINHIVEKHPEVNFYIISNDALDYTQRIKNSTLIIWDKDKYISDLSKITVGIMPLEDNIYNQGKCGFKLVQYLNMKKPVVASNVGVNSSIVDKRGIIANTKEEWEQALEKLLYDKDVYEKCVNNIEDEFFDTYHYGNVSKKLIKILNE